MASKSQSESIVTVTAVLPLMVISITTTALLPCYTTPRPLKRTYAVILEDSITHSDSKKPTTPSNSSTFSTTPAAAGKPAFQSRPLTRSNAFIQWETIGRQAKPNSSSDIAMPVKKRLRVDENVPACDPFMDVFEIERGECQPMHRMNPPQRSILKPFNRSGISNASQSTHVTGQETVTRFVRMEVDNVDFKLWRQRAFKGMVPRRAGGTKVKSSLRVRRFPGLLADPDLRKSTAEVHSVQALRNATTNAQDVLLESVEGMVLTPLASTF
ncbi:hypothetical protein FRC03_012839 [Tulasnella sp. 419]|nr:hypothetical protein FRC03_012839 [Tulasnella sp. 419]